MELFSRLTNRNQRLRPVIRQCYIDEQVECLTLASIGEVITLMPEGNHTGEKPVRTGTHISIEQGKRLQEKRKLLLTEAGQLTLTTESEPQIVNEGEEDWHYLSRLYEQLIRLGDDQIFVGTRKLKISLAELNDPTDESRVNKCRAILQVYIQSLARGLGITTEE